MAPLPAPDAPIADLMADKVDDVILVRVDQIDVVDRLRPTDHAWAEALGHIMAREGQQKNIEICRLPGANRWRLVDGAHRIAGAKIVGIVHLRAEVVSAGPEDRQSRELSALLWQRALDDPIDRAAAIASLVTLKRKQAGLDVAAHRAASVTDRFKKRIDDETDETLETISNVYGWSDEIGAQIGLTGRSVRNDLMIFRGIAPSLIAKLREARHPVATNGTQLRALAKFSANPSKQQRIVEMLLHPLTAAKTVSTALQMLEGSNRPIDPEAKQHARFIGTFGRMSLGTKKGALEELRGILPSGYRLANDAREGSPDDKYRLEMLDAMDGAIALFDTLREGTAPVGDDQLHAARTALQLARMAASAGTVPAPKGDDA